MVFDEGREMRELPSIDRMRELIDYDPETGLMTYKQAAGYRGCHKAGRPVAHVSLDGYLTGVLDGVRYYMHRVAYALAHGEHPTQLIDHINGIKTDNRRANLRDASARVNAENRRAAPKTKTSTRLLGVQKVGNRWLAAIRSSRKTSRIGYYDTPEAAHAAYVTAKREMHAGNTL